ncbi:META domain-containing protein [Cetobacterium ceti]
MNKKNIFLMVIFLILIGCTMGNIKGKDNFKQVVGKEYYLELNDKVSDININFEGNRVYGFGGINRYFGEYELGKDEQIVIKNIGRTRMGGDLLVMKEENNYIDNLENIEKYKIKNQNLFLETKNKKILKFVLKEGKSK